MHVLVIPSIYSTPAEPIRGRHFWEQAVTLQARGHRVGIIAIPSRVRTWHGLREIRSHWRWPEGKVVIEASDPVPVYRLPWWGARGVFSIRQRADLALAAFEGYCDRYGRPDVVYARGVLLGGYVSARIKEKWHVPFVIMEEFSAPYLRGILFPDDRRIIQATIRASDYVLAMSAPLAEALHRLGADKAIEVLPNSVNTDFFSPDPQPLPASPFKFAFVARLDANKAPSILLKAFDEAFPGQDVQLMIAGDGPERQALERLSVQFRLVDRVHFLGGIDREQVRQVLRSCHALVSTSYIETFGNTLIEAMSCGKPVVSTLSGGPNSIVDENVGIVVPAGDVIALANGLRTMFEHYADYDPALIRQQCIARFGEDVVLGQLEKIFASVIQGSTASPQ